jgi:2'-5' RNA ligase
MPSQRLFLALALPDAIRTLLSELAEPLPHVRWTPADQLHVTLRFLGDVESSALDALLVRLATIQVEPFLLPIEGVGAFPPKSAPRVLWAGTGKGHPRLFQLRKQLDDTALAAGVDFDVRSFHPHVTLARCADEAAGAAAGWLRRHQAFEGPPFKVDAFDLVASDLRPTGAEHHLIERFPIAAASSA